MQTFFQLSRKMKNIIHFPLFIPGSLSLVNKHICDANENIAHILIAYSDLFSNIYMIM